MLKYIKAGVVVAGLLVPAGLLAWLLSVDLGPVLEEEREAQAVLIPTGVGLFDDRQRATLRVRWEQGRQVVGAGGDGLTVALHVRSGDVVRSGDRVAEVSGRTVVALQSDSPLYRPLGLGDQGPDVRRLESLLVDMGFLSYDYQPTGTVNSRVLEAIKEANHSLGGAIARQVPGDGEPRVEFDSALTVWIGPEPLTVGAVTARVGLSWPGAGEEVMRGATSIAAAEVLPLAPPGGSELSRPAPLSLDDRYVLSLPETRLADIDMHLNPDGTLDEAAIRLLLDNLEQERNDIPALVRLLEPRAGVTVPPSALVDGPDGTCIYTGADKSSAVAVELLSTDFGQATVSPSRPIEQALANPRQVFADPSCG